MVRRVGGRRFLLKVKLKLTTTDLFITNEQSSLINYSTCETGIFYYYKMLDAFFESNFH